MSASLFQDQARWDGDLAKMAPAEVCRMISKTEARALVDQIKSGINSVRKQLYELYQREGWRALGYGSWRECVVAEFPQGESSLYKQLEAAKVEVVLLDNCPKNIGEIPEGRLRPLVPLLDNPDELREAYGVASDRTDGKPTGRAVKAAVDEVLARREPLPGQRSLPDGGGGVREPLTDEEAAELARCEEVIARGLDAIRLNVPRKKRPQGPGLDGPAFPPEPGEVRPFRNWEAFIAELNNQYLWIRENGGITGYTQGWTAKQITFIRENLKRFRNNFDGWIKELEEVSTS